MNPRSSTRGATALALAFVLVLGACGGDAEETTTSAVADDQGTRASDAAAPTTAAETTTTVAETTTTVAAGQFSGDADSEWCRRARELDTLNPMEGIDFTDPVAVEAAFDDMIGMLEDIADMAPNDIAGDVAVSLDSFKQAYEVLRAVDFDFLAFADDTEALSDLDDPAVLAAADRIAAYNFEVCGIEPDDTVEDGAIDDLVDAGGLTGILAEQFQALGFTPEEATCIAENIDVTLFTTGNLEPGSAAFQNIIDVFELCEIDIERLAILGGS